MGDTDETNAVQDWEPPPGVIVSIVLGTVLMWHLRGTRNKAYLVYLYPKKNDI